MRGGVRVLDGTQMDDFASPLGDLGEWKIHLGPAGPLGYGAGVFELNENLCPVTWLIRPTVKGEHPKSATVQFLQDTTKTIGIVASTSGGAVLQAYSRQGVLLNEAPLARFLAWPLYSDSLMHVGNGYLLSGKQLVWIGASDDRRVWRLGPRLPKDIYEYHRNRSPYFYSPRVAGSCLYVTGYGGQLFVFDLNHFMGAER